MGDHLPGILKAAEHSLERKRKEVAMQIIGIIEDDPGLLAEAKGIMQGKDPHVAYTRTGFAGRLSDKVGFRVDNDRFIEMMYQMMNLPYDVYERLFRAAVDYKQRNTQEYFREGFGEEFDGNIVE
jgi:hypothetical protein